MDERAFYTESPGARPAQLHCPYCRTVQQVELRWLIRRRKERVPPGADARDRARFEKAQSYMVLLDDRARCGNPRCRKTFEVSGIKTMAFMADEQSS
ncbi:MAG TPA: hypothetical protein VFQ91_00450 [Bryobacteraceae bacterium]|nr:hypothetical protein [Bryobacteraceae bacterium]